MNSRDLPVSTWIFHHPSWSYSFSLFKVGGGHPNSNLHGKPTEPMFQPTFDFIFCLSYENSGLTLHHFLTWVAPQLNLILKLWSQGWGRENTVLSNLSILLWCGPLTVGDLGSEKIRVVAFPCIFHGITSIPRSRFLQVVSPIQNIHWSHGAVYIQNNLN